MKLSTPVFPVALLLLLVSTISCMAQDEKAVFMESDLYQFSQKTKLKEIKLQKKELMTQIKKGDKNAELKLNKLATIESVIADNIEQVRPLPQAPELLKIRPNPPCPPKDCETLKGLGSIIIGDDLKNVTAVVLDNKGKTVGKLNDKVISQNAKLGYKEYGFTLKKNVSGPITIKITRTPKIGKPVTYSYEATLQ